MKKFAFGVLALVLAAGALVGGRFAVTMFKPVTWSDTEVKEDRAVVAAMFFSNFCASCKILDPKITAVRPEFLERPIDFVKFNQSYSALNAGELRAIAEAHGIPEIYDTYAGQTGFMVLVDPESQGIIEIVTVGYSESDIRRALERALASAPGA